MESLRQRGMFEDGDPMTLFESAEDGKTWISALRAYVLLPDGCQTLEEAFTQQYALDT